MTVNSCASINYLAIEIQAKNPSLYRCFLCINLKKLSLCYGKEHYLEFNSFKVLQDCVYLTITMVTGLFGKISAFLYTLSELLQKRRILFFCQHLKEFQTRPDNSPLSGMITDQFNFYNVDKHDSSSCFFFMFTMV